MKITIAFAGVALLALVCPAMAQNSGGAATSGGATAQAPAPPPEMPPPAPPPEMPPPPPPPPPFMAGEGWYLGLGGGWAGLGAVKWDTNFGDFGELSGGGGGLVAGLAGYKFDHFRIEIEGGGDWHGSENLVFVGPVVNPLGTTGTTSSSSHSLDIYDVLFNAIYDVRFGERWFAPIGAGIGEGFSHFSYGNSNGVDFSISRNGFMWQAIAGLGYHISSNLDIFAEYRYRDLADNHTVTLPFTVLNPPIVATLTTHNLTENVAMFGLRWFVWSPPME
jgi:opacity protein-like surface antigen